MPSFIYTGCKILGRDTVSQRDTLGDERNLMDVAKVFLSFEREREIPISGEEIGIKTEESSVLTRGKL